MRFPILKTTLACVLTMGVLLLTACDGGKKPAGSTPAATTTTGNGQTTAPSEETSGSGTEVSSATDTQGPSDSGSADTKKPTSKAKATTSRAGTVTTRRVTTVTQKPTTTTKAVVYPDPPNGNFAYQTSSFDKAGDMKFLAARSESFTQGQVKDVSAKPSGGIYNAKDFGAIPNDMADDSAALNAAMRKVASSGGVLYVPAGLYILTQPLTVPGGVNVHGDFTDVNNRNSTVFLAYTGHGQEDGTPLITMNGSSAMKGIEIYYPKQNKNAPVAYPPTFEVNGSDVGLEDIFAVNPWYAVKGVKDSGRHTIRNFYGQPLKTGIVIDHCLDVGRLRNVTFRSYWSANAAAYTRNNLTAYTFGKTDWEYVYDIYAENAKVGVRVTPLESTGNILFNGADMRGCQQSVLVDDCQAHAGVAFTDSVLEGQFATEYTNGGPVKVQNSVIRANAYKDIVMDLHGSGTVIVTGCTIDTAGGKNAAAWAVKINTDRSAFTGNTFTGKYTKHIYVDQSSLGAVLTGNAVTSGKLTVEDVSSGDCFY